MKSHKVVLDPMLEKNSVQQNAPISADADAIIIGAGISGMYQLIRLRELGMKLKVFEAGSDLGGTWYWNRYPGARFDSESWSYGYSFSQELLQEWEWTEHFSAQPDTLRYLDFVANKFDLRKHITFNSRIKAAHFDDAQNIWTVTLESGETCSAPLLILGLVRFPHRPCPIFLGEIPSRAKPSIPPAGRMIR